MKKILDIFHKMSLGVMIITVLADFNTIVIFVSISVMWGIVMLEIFLLIRELRVSDQHSLDLNLEGSETHNWMKEGF